MFQKLAFVLCAGVLAAIGVGIAQTRQVQTPQSVTGQVQAGQTAGQIQTAGTAVGQAAGQIQTTGQGQARPKLPTSGDAATITLGDDLANEDHIDSSKRKILEVKFMELYGSSNDIKIQKSAVAGTIALGVIIHEEAGVLYLDSDPCDKKTEVFRGNFRKTSLGKKMKCGDKEHDLYEVRQQ